MGAAESVQVAPEPRASERKESLDLAFTSRRSSSDYSNVSRSRSRSVVVPRNTAGTNMLTNSLRRKSDPTLKLGTSVERLQDYTESAVEKEQV